MTTQELSAAKHGARVTWRRELEDSIEVECGYVVDLRTSKPNAEPPLLYIQWARGQRTDGRDDWALGHASFD